MKQNVTRKEPKKALEKNERLKDTINNSVNKKVVRRRKRKIGYKEWWNRNCTREKRRVHRVYQKWERVKINRRTYIEEKKNLRRYLDEVKESGVEEGGEEFKGIKIKRIYGN